MPGQAIVTIKDKQWRVAVASTYAELTSGLSGVGSIPPQTGVLFDLGYDQKYIQIDMSRMLFPLAIIFINSTQGLVGVVDNASPGLPVLLNNDRLPGARCFLEVNAGEAEGIVVGDSVVIQGYVQRAQLDIGTVTTFMVALAVMVMMTRMVGNMLTPPKRPELLPQTRDKVKRPARDEVEVASWVERDRIGIWLTDRRTDKTIIEWWDEAAAQMFEDGFFKPGRIAGGTITGQEFESSVLDYAEDIGVLEKSKEKPVYLPQTVERGEAIEIPFKDAPPWVQVEWKRLHPGSVPRVKVYRATLARIHSPFFEYAVRDIVAHKAGKTLSRYVPSYESLLSASPEEKELYFGGAVKLGPDEAIAVMDYWGDRFKSIDLYVHPAAYEPPKVVAPSLTDRQMKILATIRAYTPAYRKEVFAEHQVTQAELDELQRMGLIDRRGAITVMGRNIVGRQSPLDRWGAWPMTELKALPSVVVMPHLPKEAKGDILFVLYMRDLVALGEEISDQEARIMWEEWQKQEKPHLTALPATQRKEYVWVRYGDVSEYFSFDSPYNAGMGVGRVLAEYPTREFSYHYVSGGVAIKPHYTGRNYISLFWGDEAAQWLRGLSEADRREFAKGVSHVLRENTGMMWGAYYWTAVNKDTGEIVENYTPHTSSSRALRGGKAFVSRHWQGLALVEVWKQPGRYSEDLKIEPVASEKVVLGKSPSVIPAKGKTTCPPPGERALLDPQRFPKRTEALAKLRGYEVIQVHDDGDLTVRSQGKLYVVTTEGQTFEQKEHLLQVKSAQPRVIPAKAQPDKEGDLEYLADSPEYLTQTIEAIGYRDKLDNAFQQAIARAKGLE